MFFPNLRRLGLLGALVGLILSLPAASAVEGKHFAADEYHWWPSRIWVDHFQSRKPNQRLWSKFGRGVLAHRYQMLSLTSGRYGSLFATRRGGVAHRYGRWEVRVRGHEYESGHRPYAVGVELIPKRRAGLHCGAQNIAIGRWVPTHHAAHFYARSLPAAEFRSSKPRMDFSNGYWHTFAVEVRPKKITWFVDGYPRAVERRTDALSGRRMVVRVGLDGVRGERMNKSRIQVDTVRYFSLETPNRKRVSAPRASRGTYEDAC